MAQIVPIRKQIALKQNKLFNLNRFCKKADNGVIMATTKRLPVVSHCTALVDTEKSDMIVGKATLTAVSIKRPQKDTRQAATTESVRLAGILTVSLLITIKTSLLLNTYLQKPYQELPSDANQS